MREDDNPKKCNWCGEEYETIADAMECQGSHTREDEEITKKTGYKGNSTSLVDNWKKGNHDHKRA